MNAQQLNKKLERGVFGASIKQLGGLWGALGAPSDTTYAHGAVDSVTQQARRVDATWNAANKRLTIQAAAGGPGLWIPYLGNGVTELSRQAAIDAGGLAHTVGCGLGSYTQVGAGGANWVATGPFSGCYAVTLTAPGGDKVFAHVITPAAGYTAADPVTQAVDIANQVGAIPPSPDELSNSKVTGGGIGYVFWTRLNGIWWRRVIFAGVGNPATVMSVGRKKHC
jgi:hypothetical protein